MGLFSKEIHTHTHTNSHSERLVPYEKTVHEHRAPTDKSVELLNEFQQKAIDNIFHSFKIDDNIIKADAFVLWTNPTDFNMTFACRFKINGKEFDVRENIDMFKFRHNLKNHFNSNDFKLDVLQMVYKVVSEKIALDLIILSQQEVLSFIEKI